MNQFFKRINQPVWYDPTKQVIFDPDDDERWEAETWDLWHPMCYRANRNTITFSKLPYPTVHV